MTSPFPDWLQPMAATLTEERFTGSDWIFERKYDGIRVLAFKHGDEVRLLSRNRLPLNSSYPAVVRAIAALPVDDVILDGESTAGWEQAGDADYYVFDILRLDGRDLTALPLEERRALLERLPLQLPLERVAWLNDEHPWDRACAEGWEGVIAKRRDSRYEHRAVEELAEDEVRRDARLRRRRLHRSAGQARRAWRPAGRLLRWSRSLLRRQARNRLRQRAAASTCARVWTHSSCRKRLLHAPRGCRGCERIGSSRRLSSRPASSNGPETASCGTRGCCAFSTAWQLSTSCAASTARLQVLTRNVSDHSS